MNVEYYHASKYGNGAIVAEEFQRQMAAIGTTVNLHHVREAKPNQTMPQADLYVFSSPGRFGKPVGEMQRFVKEANLPAGTRYALVATELAPKPDNQAQLPAGEEPGKCQRVIPFMNGVLQKKGLVKAAEGKIYVTGIKGPLEDGWQQKVKALAFQMLSCLDALMEV